jgi:hypothetical protein
MGNCCSYNACVKGKPDIVDKVVKYIVDHSYDGVPDIRLVPSLLSRENSGIKIVIVNGDCKYSVFNAFNIGKYCGSKLFYSAEKDDDPNTKTMIELANKLNEQYMNSESMLDIRGDNDDDYKIEVFSKESSMGFAEHYILSAGKIILDDCRDFYESFDEETGITTFNGGFEHIEFSFDPTHIIPEYKDYIIKD